MYKLIVCFCLFVFCASPQKLVNDFLFPASRLIQALKKSGDYMYMYVCMYLHGVTISLVPGLLQ